MPERSYVRNSDGDIEYIRETAEDGRESRLYEYDGSLIGQLFGERGDCLEVAEHREDGTTVAYEYDGSWWGSLVTGNKGEQK